MSKNNNRDISRRQFLATAVGTSSALLLGPMLPNASAQGDDPRMAKVLSKTIGVDMHNHVYPAGTEPHPGGGPPPQQGRQEDQHSQDLSLTEEIKQSGLTAVCASFVLDFTQNKKPGDARENYLGWLTAIDAELEKSKMRRALTLRDLETAHRLGQPTIVQTVEGAQFIEGHLDRVEEVYKRGLRHLQLLHMRDDMVSPLGDVITASPHLGGLTPFGADVVKECNRLGILVDLAHATPETVLGALKVTTKPILVSHTGLDSQTGGNPRMAEMMKPHLISKEHAKVVADAGGVVGVWTKLADSLKGFVENIRAMVDAIGIDHVGIGTDTDLLSSRVGSGTNRAWVGLTGGFFYVVVAEMLHQGFTPDEIVKVGGGNYCRVFDRATSVHG
jgi:membrane dipeptidase